MLTDRGKALLISGIGLWVASRVFGIEEMAMAALAVVILIGLAVIFTVLTSARISARRSVHPPRMFYDTEGSVDLRIRNDGRLPTAILQVDDSAPTSLADGHRFVVAPLGSGMSRALRYRLHARQRGRYVVGPLRLKLRDPFGIAARQQLFGGVDEVIVYPPIWRLPPGVPLAGHIGAGGEGRPRPLATGEELANVREYVRGDDLRKVHWRSTAHRGELMVRQDEAPQNPNATLILDIRHGAHFGVGPLASFEQAVSAAASVAYHLAERAFAVTLLTRPLGAPARALPWELILEQLAVIGARDDVDLDGLWQQVGTGVAGSGLVVGVVAAPDPALTRTMVRAGRGFSSRLAILIDSEGFSGRRRRTVDVERTVAALRIAGWRVTVVSRGDRLDDRWQELALTTRGRPVAPAGGRGR